MVLSGGSGTRLWPMSRPERPKQFLRLVGEQSLFEQTLARVRGNCFAAPLVVASERHRALLEPYRAQIGRLVLEPCSRNTASAIAFAAFAARPNEILLVLPSDHVIGDPDAFNRAVELAFPFARTGHLVTFGVRPKRADTGFGYIESGQPLGKGVRRVKRFVEKPSAKVAQAFVETGEYFWNAGIFMFRADAFLSELELHAPAIYQASVAAFSAACVDDGVIVPEEASLAAGPALSIDHAVLERSKHVAVVPVDLQWSDVGSWDAIHELQDSAMTSPHVVAIDTKNCFFRSDGVRIAAIGTENLLVVAEGNEILIVPVGKSQAVKLLSEMGVSSPPGSD